MRFLRVLAICLAGLAALPAAAEPVPRRVLVLWDSSVTTRWRDTFAHQMLEMPLNRLGFVVEHVDVARKLPGPEAFEGARAVVSWLESDTVPDPAAAFAFVDAATARGLRLVVLGEPAFLRRRGGGGISLADANRVFARAGFALQDDFVRLTFDVEVVAKEAASIEYERPLDRALPPFPVWRPVDARARPLLVLRRRGVPGTESHVAMTAPGGGVVAFGYTHFFEPELRRRQWRIDPFAFLASALGVEPDPVPDVTTLVGRRIYFSHVDGDGWRNVTEIQPWRRARKLSSEVIFDEVLARHPDLPVTIAPVVADLHPEWCGTAETRDIARRMFALPHVEAGSHTWTHPLDWNFFAAPDAEARERAFLRRYPGCRAEPSRLAALYDRVKRRIADVAANPDDGSEFEGQYGAIGSYNTPRSFALRPFDLGHEIVEAAQYIGTLLPPGKRVPIVQWSGNTLPFEAVLRATREAGMFNINGGDTRFDDEFASVSYVAPIGRRVGNERQIYTAASNENTYTDLWTDRFFGFRALVETFERTGAPRRLAPMNLYYHVYSAEKEPALRALRDNLAHVQASEIVPLFASQYAAIANGFFAAKIERAGPRAWRVSERGALQTLRLDPPADALAVDFATSRGVLGFRRDAGALYVALDPDVAEATVALAERPGFVRPFLVHSRWPLRGFAADAGGFAFRAAGFGPGEMRWQAEPGRLYRIDAAGSSAGAARAGPDGTLDFALPRAYGREIAVRVTGPLP